jgi:hypothetical protein
MTILMISAATPQPANRIQVLQLGLPDAAKRVSCGLLCKPDEPGAALPSMHDLSVGILLFALKPFFLPDTKLPESILTTSTLLVLTGENNAL